MRKICIISLAFFAFFFSMGGYAANLSVPVDTLAQNKELRDSLSNMVGPLSFELKQLDDSLTALKASISELNSRETPKPLFTKEDIDKKLISMASNFLYIPYQEFGVKNIAIPAFEATKGSDLYSDHIIRLSLLQYYNADIKVLANFIEESLAQPEKINQSIKRKVVGTKTLANLKALPLYSRYNQYNDWKETYLGKQIMLLEKIYSNPEDNDWISKLSTIKNELDSLIDTNQQYLKE